MSGYAFGFFDACLQAKRLDIRDPEGEGTLLHLLARLFPAEAAACTVDACAMFPKTLSDPGACWTRKQYHPLTVSPSAAT